MSFLRHGFLPRLLMIIFAIGAFEGARACAIHCDCHRRHYP